MRELFGAYGVKARLFPALLCVPPFLLVKHFALDPLFGPSFMSRLVYEAAGDVSLASVLVYLLAQANRFVSIVLFEARTEFPTTRMLLPSSGDLSDEFRKKIDAKTQSDFQLSLPTLADEKASATTVRTRIKEIVSLIINKVGSGRLLLQHNIEYGFVRNLIGGAVIAFGMSIAAAFCFSLFVDNRSALIASICLALCYLLPVFFSKPLLATYGGAYAVILFREYVGSSHRSTGSESSPSNR